MRWILKPAPKIGDERVITKFAWLPIQIASEIIWLQMVTIRQIYIQDHWKHKTLGKWFAKEFLSTNKL